MRVNVLCLMICTTLGCYASEEPSLTQETMQLNLSHLKVRLDRFEHILPTTAPPGDQEWTAKTIETLNEQNNFLIYSCRFLSQEKKLAEEVNQQLLMHLRQLTLSLNESSALLKENVERIKLLEEENKDLSVAARSADFETFIITGTNRVLSKQNSRLIKKLTKARKQLNRKRRRKRSKARRKG